MGKVLMGGSGSTGSSLLKNILNRNERIFSGGETAFLSKRLVYDDWPKAKKRLQRRKTKGLRNFGFHIYNGTDMCSPEYLWKPDELDSAAVASMNLDEFCEVYFGKALELTGATTWIEKTPANAACFASFLNHFQDSKVIHMVRNPYDTIASLCNRGFSLHYAVGIYLLNTASGLSARHFKGRCHIVKYEDLIKDPDGTVSEVCRFLEVSYDSSMLESQNEQIADSKLDGWNYDETQNIGKKAVGRFKKLEDDEQTKILEATNLVSINDRGCDYYDIDVSSVQEICEILDYDFYQIGSSGVRKQLKRLQRVDRLNRLRRGYPTGVYYPLQIQG